MSLRISKEFVVIYKGAVLARCVDFDLEINKKVIDLTTLDSDSWMEILSDQKDWKISFNALIARAGANNYDAMLDDIKNNEEPVLVAVGGRVDGSAIEEGYGLLTQVRFSARVGERAAYSGTISGTGPLTTRTRPSALANINTFSIAGQVGSTVINPFNNQVDVLMPFGTTVTALVPTFTLSPNATAKIGTSTQTSGVSAVDFTTAKVYVITAEDGTTTKSYTVTVTLQDE